MGTAVRGVRNALTVTTTGKANLSLKAASGVIVNEKAALTASAFFDGVRIIAEDLGLLPFPVYRRLPRDGKQRAPESSWWRLIHDRPNAWQSSQQFRECMSGLALLRGNALALPVVVRGTTQELLPLRPDEWRVEQHWDFSLTYWIRNDQGRETPYTRDQVFHLAGFGLDGVTGLNLLEMARDTIGESLAEREYASKLYANGARPGGYLQASQGLTKDQALHIREEWEGLHQGLDNSHRFAVLPFGMSWQDVGMTAEAAKLIESRQFSVAEFARWLRLPPHKLGELGRATWANIEHQSIDYVVGTLLPWIRRWENAFNLQVLKSDTYFGEMIVEGLLRGDTASRYDAYTKALGSNNGPGWMTPNEARVRENLEPMDGLDEVFRPAAAPAS